MGMDPVSHPLRDARAERQMVEICHNRNSCLIKLPWKWTTLAVDLVGRQIRLLSSDTRLPLFAAGARLADCLLVELGYQLR